MSEATRSSEARPIAFFDVDDTLVDGNTARLYALFALRHGELSRWTALRLIWSAMCYRLGWLDARPRMARTAATLAGLDEADFDARCESLFDELIRPRIRPGARARVQAHREAGHHVALLTTTIRPIVAPLGLDLEMDHVLANELETADGLLTGRFLEPLCYGPGKVTHARRLAGELGSDLQSCWFYTDSIRDRDMLEAAGHPVVVTPDRRLDRLARRRGWRQDDLNGPLDGSLDMPREGGESAA